MERNMKQSKLLIGLVLLIFACSVSPATINGRFDVNEVNGIKSVILQINTNTAMNELGGTTIVFNFDTTSISFPNNPVNEIDYIFHNFNGGNYSSATVTRPLKNQIWVNIDLPYTNNNNGTIVAASPNWTDVVTINFSIVDQSRSANLTWLTTSPFWGVYDADNSTLWQDGDFEDFITGVEQVSEFPTNFELLQNYPNPFNPSTKIRYTIPAIHTGQTGSPNLYKGGTLVQLKVYDILGNEVATLVNEEKEPGIYEVEFSNINATSSIASGIYIYKIHSGNFVDSKKMVLLK
jgi:hypothetical protein